MVETVKAYHWQAASELRRVTAIWDATDKEKLFVSNYAWNKLWYIQDVISESSTHIEYERSAVEEKEEELWIDSNTSHEIHRHPDLTVYRSQTDVNNRTQQYIDSNWKKNDFRIVVRDPKLWVTIVVAYDHAWNVRMQNAWGIDCWITMIWRDNVSRPMLLEPSIDELKNVRLAIDRYKITQALFANLTDEAPLPQNIRKDVALWKSKPVINEYAQDIEHLEKELFKDKSIDTLSQG